MVTLCGIGAISWIHFSLTSCMARKGARRMQSIYEKSTSLWMIPFKVDNSHLVTSLK
jgi:hypothetical protein